ncbi:MAG: hypothetical protein R2939_11440 [Kofleriaceae bacterium]
MAAVDLPPGLGLVGSSRHAFRARPGPRRLAGVALLSTSVLCVLAWYFASRQPWRLRSGWYAVMPMVFVAVAGVGYAVRRAQVWLDRGGVRWGWGGLSIRVEPERLREIQIYADGLALAIGRGAPWFLARRDWADFGALVRDARRAGFPLVEHAGRAPWRARLQAYGGVLDGLMVVAMLGACGLVLAAAG